MINFQAVWKFSWRIVLIALAYMAGLLIAGFIGEMPGMQTATEADRGPSLIQLFAAGLLLGVFLGFYASEVKYEGHH